MEDKISVRDEKQLATKNKFTKCLSGPKQIIRSAVLLTCSVVVIYQIGECLRKIRYPSITTYTHFDLNETIKFPAVTVCRDPPYKHDILQKYGLYGHPRYTSEWKHFNFDSVNLDDFWKEATYSDKDNFLSVGLNFSMLNVDIVNSMHFILGQCQTLFPKINPTFVTKDSGYSISLNHSMSELSNTTSTIPPGYHIYIHQDSEPFTEHLSASLMEYLYVNVGEELEVKLRVQQLNMLSNGPKKCETIDDYSANLCAEKCARKKIIDKLECSGPWMNDNTTYCKNYTDMKDLIVNYIRSLRNEDCVCPQPCRSSLYSTYVVDRNSLTKWNPMINEWVAKSGHEKLLVQVFLYFNNKLVSIYEENHSYDWSLFLADFGGSLGFLLGLSVLGVIVILEDIFDSCIKPLITSNADETPQKTERGKKVSVSSDSTTSTVDYNEKRNIIRDYNRFNIKYDDKNFYM